MLACIPDRHRVATEWFRAADIQAVYRESKAEACGAEYLAEPKHRGSEIRCCLKDPDSRLIKAGQPS